MVILGAQRLGMFDRVMSALGQKQTYAVHKPMSALPPKADSCSALADVRAAYARHVRKPTKNDAHGISVSIRELYRKSAIESELLCVSGVPDLG